MLRSAQMSERALRLCCNQTYMCVATVECLDVVLFRVAYAGMTRQTAIRDFYRLRGRRTPLQYISVREALTKPFCLRSTGERHACC